MEKFTKIENYADALKVKVATIDPKKFDIELTEEILIKNGWGQATCTSFRGGPQNGWVPECLGRRYDEEKGEWVEIDDDFEDVFIWFRASKDAWCYKYAFGTYVYQIKSVGELEIILAREGFIYDFDI